MLSTLVTWEAH